MADKKLKQDLELLKTDELIDIIIDQSKQLEKHEEKERQEKKQRPIPNDWPVNIERKT